MTREEQFLSQLDVIDRVIGWVCARRGLRGADAEDFASVVRCRLVENDYEVLARFEGRSSLKTYLVAVINRHYLDFQVERFGKWRASAEARRLGAVALRLERLLFRDGLPFDEACGVLQSDPAVKESRDALYALSLKLPLRTSRRSAVGEAWAPALTAAEPPAAETAERQALAERTFSLIARSLRRLPDADRVVFRLLLEDGLTVAQVSRARGLDQKALYRRREEVFASIRTDLTREGIGVDEVGELLETIDWHAMLRIDEPGAESVREESGTRPSQEHGASTPRGGGA